MTLVVKDGTGTNQNLSEYTDGSSEKNPRHSLITAEGAGATIGTTGDAAVTTNTTGTLSGKIRGIIAILLDVVGTAADAVVGAGAAGSLSAKIRKISETVGDTADANTFASTGSISGKLRSLANYLSDIDSLSSTIHIDISSTIGGVVGTTADGAVTTNTTGTISGKIRGIVALLAAAIDITNGFVKSQILPFTSGGLSNYHVVSAASTNTANIKASAGQVYGWNIFNNAAYNVYVKLHNTAGTPTAGSGVIKTIGIPAAGGNNWSSDIGIPFGTGIGISIVKDITDAGATAVALSDCVVDIEYK